MKKQFKYKSGEEQRHDVMIAILESVGVAEAVGFLLLIALKK